ncbi:MAG: hypothetical protein QW551_04415 [Desulfurococcaceae archaeon]
MVSLVIVIIALIAPLIIFINDFIGNPGCLSIHSEEIEQINEDQYRVVTRINYCSSISLKELRLVIGNKEIVLNNLVKGVTEKEITLTRNDLEIGVRRVEVNILGIYKLTLELSR